VCVCVCLCVCVCVREREREGERERDLETSTIRRPRPDWGCCDTSTAISHILNIQGLSQWAIMDYLAEKCCIETVLIISLATICEISETG
jgi:hypothetical protein